MSDAEPILRELLQNIATENKYDKHNIIIKPISSGGANYTSQLYLATLHDENNKEVYMFAKVAAVGESFREQTPMKLYDTERFAYTKLLKLYAKLQEEHEVPEKDRLQPPKFYGFNQKLYEEIIVLENLERRGFTTYDRFRSITWEYAVSATREMAKLHALSMAYQHQHPEEFAAIQETLKFEWTIDEVQGKLFWDTAIKRALDNTREENKEKLRRFLEDDNLIGLNAFPGYYKALRRHVISHGDYRPSNLMHRTNEDGELEVIAVDYQTLQAGSPVVDLLYFIFTGSDEQFRAQYYQQLLDHYYTELTAAMRRLHLDPEKTYSREDFEFELKEKLPFGLAIAVFTLPIITVEAENAPKVDKDMDLSSFSIQKTGELFPERLNGVVNDYVKWGVLK